MRGSHACHMTQPTCSFLKWQVIMMIQIMRASKIDIIRNLATSYSVKSESNYHSNLPASPAFAIFLLSNNLRITGTHLQTCQSILFWRESSNATRKSNINRAEVLFTTALQTATKFWQNSTTAANELAGPRWLWRAKRHPLWLGAITQIYLKLYLYSSQWSMLNRQIQVIATIR